MIKRKKSSVEIFRGGTTGDMLKDFYNEVRRRQKTSEEVILLSAEEKCRDPSSILKEVLRFLERANS